jgi:hypothetical protein
VNDALIKYYELLGVAPGVSMQELKTAHRDLAKVWHPDRFAHDPRLQQKAQEKLKEINEAYDQLASGKAGRRTRVSAQPNHSQSPPPRASAPRTGWKLIRILPTAIVFVILFFAVTRVLITKLKSLAQSTTQSAEQSQATLDEEGQSSDSVNRARAADAARGKRADQQPAKEAKPDSAPNFEQEARQVMKPLPTVTLTIDPVSGMLAKADCPVKSRMTYPSGSEPRQYCNIQHKIEAPEQAEQGRPKESCLKSFAKRVAAPASKLFGGKGGSDAESRQGAKSPGSNNR